MYSRYASLTAALPLTISSTQTINSGTTVVYLDDLRYVEVIRVDDLSEVRVKPKYDDRDLATWRTNKVKHARRR